MQVLAPHQATLLLGLCYRDGEFTLTDFLQSLKNHAPAGSKHMILPFIRTYGRATSRSRPLPDFLIIGTKRGGTTSLLKYLRLHPQVLPMWPAAENAKKTWFFDDRYRYGEQWYRSHFPTQRQRDKAVRQHGTPVLSGEAAPYYMFNPRVPSRVATTMPDVRVVVSLRNPVDRAWSHWRERRASGAEPLDFAEALAAEEARLAGEEARMLAEPDYISTAHDHFSYRSRGRYLEQLERWWRLVPREQMHVLRSEDMYRDPNSVLKGLHEFLGLPFVPVSAPHRFNYLPSEPLSPDIRSDLAAYYRPHVRALEAELHRDMHWDL
jgi:hypothetical protein